MEKKHNMVNTVFNYSELTIKSLKFRNTYCCFHCRCDKHVADEISHLKLFKIYTSELKKILFSYPLSSYSEHTDRTLEACYLLIVLILILTLQLNESL